MHIRKNWLLIPCLLFFNFLVAQNYQAINGSSYAGSLAQGNNPAAIIQVPYAWDVTLFSFQLKQSTNAFVIENYSLLSSPKNAEIYGKNGVQKLYLFANQDIRLLNARLNLNERSAIAFGANLRNYIHSTTTQVHWQDTIQRLADFMGLNLGTIPMAGESRGSAWAELYFSYAHTIIDDGDHYLDAGITLKADRGLGAESVDATDLAYKTLPPAPVQGYELTKGVLQYGYSSNFDNINSNNSSSANRKAFLSTTRSSFTADLGLQFIIRSNEYVDETGDYTYSTKIGASLMDLGKNKFRYGRLSSIATAGLPGITDSILESKFSGIGSFEDFNDSLSSISASFDHIYGDFFIYQPARMVLNLDQHLLNNFFINAELTIQAMSLAPKRVRYIKDMNFIAITPRWETRTWGAYLPVLINTKNQTWVGGAVKAGPVLFGSHNLANLFSKNSVQNGGLYLAVTIRPSKSKDGELLFSGDKQSRKSKRSLECPKF